METFFNVIKEEDIRREEIKWETKKKENETYLFIQNGKSQENQTKKRSTIKLDNGLATIEGKMDKWYMETSP